MGAYFTYYLTGFIMIPVFLFAAICQWKVNIAFNKYSRVRGSRGMTGADAAYQLLKINGVNDVKIKRVSGNLTDHYNPKTKEICLSEAFFHQQALQRLVLRVTRLVTHVSTQKVIFR